MSKSYVDQWLDFYFGELAKEMGITTEELRERAKAAGKKEIEVYREWKAS